MYLFLVAQPSLDVFNGAVTKTSSTKGKMRRQTNASNAFDLCKINWWRISYDLWLKWFENGMFNANEGTNKFFDFCRHLRMMSMILFQLKNGSFEFASKNYWRRHCGEIQQMVLTLLIAPKKERKDTTNIVRTAFRANISHLLFVYC